MKSGRFKMLSGTCQMVSGRCPGVSGSYQILPGRWKMVSGRCHMMSGMCHSYSGRWNMVSGSCNMVFGRFQMVSKRFKMVLEQCSDVWALSWSEPTFLWKNQFELICHEIHSKNVYYQFVYDQITQEIFFKQKLLFLWKLFSISSLKLGFSDLHGE